MHVVGYANQTPTELFIRLATLFATGHLAFGCLKNSLTIPFNFLATINNRTSLFFSVNFIFSFEFFFWHFILGPGLILFSLTTVYDLYLRLAIKKRLWYSHFTTRKSPVSAWNHPFSVSFNRLYFIRPFVFNPFSFNPFQFLS